MVNFLCSLVEAQFGSYPIPFIRDCQVVLTGWTQRVFNFSGKVILIMSIIWIMQLTMDPLHTIHNTKPNALLDTGREKNDGICPPSFYNRLPTLGEKEFYKEWKAHIQVNASKPLCALRGSSLQWHQLSAKNNTKYKAANVLYYEFVNYIFWCLCVIQVFY